MEADSEGGGDGEEGGPKPSATFADWPEGRDGEVAPRHQLKADATRKRRAGPSSLGGREKKLKATAAATKREEAVARAQ